jgi:hypothetical protein
MLEIVSYQIKRGYDEPILFVVANLSPKSICAFE